MLSVELPTAREWMIPGRLTLRPDQPIAEAIHELIRLSVAAAPVVDDQGQLIGMLTEKDCLRVVATTAYENEIKDGTVADFMSRVAAVIDPDMDLFRVVEVFLSCNFPTLPVVERGRLVGRLTRQQMLRSIESYMEAVARQKTQELRDHESAIQRPKSIEAMQQTAARHSREGLARLFSRRR